MKKILKRIAKQMAKRLPVSNAIIFESAPDLSDNTKPVFDELIARGINEKYKFYWICFDQYETEYPKYHNVKYISSRNKLKRYFLQCTAKIVICCNRIIGLDRKNQTVYYLMHGSPIKDTSGYYTCPDYVDYMITAGPYMNQKSAAAMVIDESKCFPLGYPRNDALIDAHIDISVYFGTYKKYIIWYPTVKQFSSGIDYGIKPIEFLDNDESVMHLNEFAKEQDVLIIVKPHFAQIANIKITNLSNIKFIDDKFYKDNHIIPYEFIGSCDALLSDYSSVFYDFMLCTKPIGLVWTDVAEFKNNLGFVDYYEEVTVGCSKIYTFEELCEFIKSVADGKDELAVERERICQMVNTPRDKRNTERVVDFIIEKSNL